MGDWTFFSNYGHVLVCLARNRQARLRDVALEVGITERAVQKIVRDLQDSGFLVVSKQGRCNRYRINKRKAMRHSLESHCSVGKLLALVARPVKAETAGIRGVQLDEPAGVEIPGAAARLVEETVESPPAPVAVSENEKERKKEKSKAPVDTREQGSLF